MHFLSKKKLNMQTLITRRMHALKAFQEGLDNLLNLASLKSTSLLLLELLDHDKESMEGTSPSHTSVPCLFLRWMSDFCGGINLCTTLLASDQKINSSGPYTVQNLFKY